MLALVSILAGVSLVSGATKSFSSCPADKELNMFGDQGGGVPNATTCCKTKTCASIACPATMTSNFGNDISVEGCCVPKLCLHADYYFCKASGEVPNYKVENQEKTMSTANCCSQGTCETVGGDLCTNDKKIFLEDGDGELLSTIANCCEAWEPTCYMYTKFASSPTYDLFPCSSGTSFNATNYKEKKPTQELCCGPFTPTCNFASGNVFNQERYKCPSGYTSKASDENGKSTSNMPATTENCCEGFKSTCANAKDDGLGGDIFQCPPGKVFNIKATEVVTVGKSSEEITVACCRDISCNDFEMKTCQDEAAYCAEKNDDLDASKLDQQFNDNAWCCKKKIVIYKNTIDLKNGVCEVGVSLLLLLAPLVLVL